MPRGGVTAAEALDSALVALDAAGVPEARLDGELLVAHALGSDRSALWIDPDRRLDGPATRWLQEAVHRRAIGREPLAYIVGVKAFRYIELEVDRRVLIPRPETEHLVEALLELPRGARVHDACTGSGAVALALKDERPDLHVSASDISGEAIAVAQANARRLGLDVDLRVGPMLAGVRDVDVVAANPPYVAEGDRRTLAPEITRHEPALALYAGASGLDVVRPLISEAAASEATVLALEVGAGQAPVVAALVAAAGFPEPAVVKDLAGIERVVVGRR